jgi:hypothetical protein
MLARINVSPAQVAPLPLGMLARPPSPPARVWSWSWICPHTNSWYGASPTPPDRRCRRGRRGAALSPLQVLVIADEPPLDQAMWDATKQRCGEEHFATADTNVDDLLCRSCQVSANDGWRWRWVPSSWYSDVYPHQPSYHVHVFDEKPYTVEKVLV